MVGDGDDDGLRIERRADVAVLAVRREDLHAGAGGHLDPRLLLEGVAVEHRHIILAAHGHPDLLAVRREEGLVRRAADIGRVLHRVGRGVDEGDGIAADRDDRDRLVIGRVAHAVDENLPLVERAEIAGLRVAEADHAEELVVDRIGHRHRVGELLGGVDPVAMADRDVRIGCGTGGLSGEGRRDRAQRGGDEARESDAVHRSGLLDVTGRDACALRRSAQPSAGGRRGLRGRRDRGRQRIADGEPHRRDLLLLGHDDFLGEPLELLVLAVAQDDLRHVDRALVMRHHHRHEIAVDVPGRRGCHVGHHLVHRGFVCGKELGFGLRSKPRVALRSRNEREAAWPASPDVPARDLWGPRRRGGCRRDNR